MKPTYHGVFWRPQRGKWSFQLSYGAHSHLSFGYWDDPEECAQFRELVYRLYFGPNPAHWIPRVGKSNFPTVVADIDSLRRIVRKLLDSNVLSPDTMREKLRIFNAWYDLTLSQS